MFRLFFLHYSEGLWPAAREVSLGKKEWEDSPALFCLEGGSEWRRLVSMWENINELLPTGRGAVPIISSWENTRGKMERQTERNEEMKEDHSLPFCFQVIHRRAKLCVAEHSLVVLLLTERDDVFVSLSNTKIPTGTPLLTSELPVGETLKHFPLGTQLWTQQQQWQS